MYRPGLLCREAGSSRKAKVSAKPELVQISTAYKQQLGTGDELGTGDGRNNPFCLRPSSREEEHRARSASIERLFVPLHAPRMPAGWQDKILLTFLTGENLPE
jgi:hypothetical protein